MSATPLIMGLAVVAGILCFLFWKLGQDPDKKHFLLQVLFLSFIVFVIVLLGKASYDYKDNCSWLVANSTSSGSTTSYEYTYECDANDNATHSSFYNLTTWIMRIVVIYLFLYYSYEVFMYFSSRGKE